MSNELFTAPRWHDDLGGEVVGYSEVSKEEQIEARKFLINALLKRKVITPEDVVIVDGVPTIKKS